MRRAPHRRRRAFVRPTAPPSAYRYETGPWAHGFSAWFMRATGVSIVPIRGKWGLPWIVPKAGDIHVRWGRAVDVGPPNGAPTDDEVAAVLDRYIVCLLYTSPSPRDKRQSRMPSSA